MILFGVAFAGDGHGVRFADGAVVTLSGDWEDIQDDSGFSFVSGAPGSRTWVEPTRGSLPCGVEAAKQRADGPVILGESELGDPWVRLEPSHDPFDCADDPGGSTWLSWRREPGADPRVLRELAASIVVQTAGFPAPDGLVDLDGTALRLPDGWVAGTRREGSWLRQDPDGLSIFPVHRYELERADAARYQRVDVQIGCPNHNWLPASDLGEAWWRDDPTGAVCTTAGDTLLGFVPHGSAPPPLDLYRQLREQLLNQATPATIFLAGCRSPCRRAGTSRQTARSPAKAGPAPLTGSCGSNTVIDAARGGALRRRAGSTGPTPPASTSPAAR